MVTQWAKHGVYNPRIDAVDYFNLGVLVNQEEKELEENIYAEISSSFKGPVIEGHDEWTTWRPVSVSALSERLGNIYGCRPSIKAIRVKGKLLLHEIGFEIEHDPSTASYRKHNVDASELYKSCRSEDMILM
ncbi:unnamed protein product [Cuscuta campestris]|uniref:Uncharacterized protein n=1 Tax=Cuscuta campestris TaxID=132261 RepID=A0A484KS05_9ASTE|nr:unnamed protein product [Cuscuta campestris]